MKLIGLAVYIFQVTVYSINEQFKLLAAAKADRGDFLGQTALVDAWYQVNMFIC